MKEQIRKILIDNITIPENLRARFFKTGIGEYAAHDKFLGVTNPILRKIAKQYKDLELNEIHQIINSPYNEERMLCLFILSAKFKLKKNQDEIYEFYIKNMGHVNNWNLVDCSAHLIMGAHLEDKPRDILLNLANSTDLWERRIAIVATWWFIRQNDLEWTIKLSKILLNDKEDLMHKAVGWMLRELGKKDVLVLTKFLNEYKHQVPRTMLRYAIEKYSLDERKMFLK